jgi:cell division septation protein DedD
LRADDADSKSPSVAAATLGSLAEEGSTATKQANSNKPEKSLNSVADLNTLPNPLTTNSDKIPEAPQNLNIQGQGGNIEQVLDTEKTSPAKATAKLTQEQSSSGPAVSKEGEISVRAKIPTGWYVQVAAPRKVQDATEIAKKLQRSGIPVMIESAQVRGEDYFRVVAGPQAQRAGAEKLLTQIKSKGSVKGDPFVRAVR